jgi:hypothetical protein
MEKYEKFGFGINIPNPQHCKLDPDQYGIRNPDPDQGGKKQFLVQRAWMFSL